MEQANIYYFDLKNSEKARTYLRRLEERFEADPVLEGLVKEWEGTTEVSTHNAVFRALKNKKVDLAYRLSIKLLKRNSQDPWAHGALAIVHLFMQDVERASYFAERAYGLLADEFTCSLKAYIEALRGNYDIAIPLYQEAIHMNAMYFPARFNLTYVYLKKKKYREGHDMLALLDRDFRDLGRSMRAKVFNNMGYALWFLGSPVQAEEQFRIALSFDPVLRVASENLTKISIDWDPDLVSQVN